jgi:hypothetical protein
MLMLFLKACIKLILQPHQNFQVNAMIMADVMKIIVFVHPKLRDLLGCVCVYILKVKIIWIP